MDILALRELKIGMAAKGALLLTDTIDKTGKKSIYRELTLTDGDQTVVAKDFNRECPFGKGDVIYVQLRADEFNGAPSYIMERVDATKTYQDILPVARFIRHPPVEERAMYDAILSRLESVCREDEERFSNGTDSIARLAIRLYQKNEEKLLVWSASKSMHHNLSGGLLYHVYRMMNLAQGFVDTYSAIYAPLLLAAVAIHDLGKLDELDTDPLGNADYTVEGGMLGHALLGIRRIEEEALQGNYDPEMVMCLKHCVASHHGRPEWDAIVMPKTLEAYILHILDLSDSRVYMFEEVYRKLEPGTETERKDFGLEAKIYRPQFTAEKL